MKMEYVLDNLKTIKSLLEDYKKYGNSKIIGKLRNAIKKYISLTEELEED